MWAVVLVDVWKTTPFMALLILAALQMLPARLLRGGGVDGIHPVKVFFRVTLPLIRPGADGGGHLPRARRAAHLRPDLRADLEQPRHHLDVGLSRASSSSTSRRSASARPRRRCCSSSSPSSPSLALTVGRVRLDEEAAAMTPGPQGDRLLAARRGHRRSTRSSRSTTPSCPRCAPARRCSRVACWPEQLRFLELCRACSASSPSPATSSTRSSSRSRWSRSRCSSA